MSATELITIADLLVQLREHCQRTGLVMDGIGLVDFTVYELPAIAHAHAPLLRKYDDPPPRAPRRDPRLQAELQAPTASAAADPRASCLD